MKISCPTDGSPGAVLALDKLIASFLPSQISVGLLAVAPGDDSAPPSPSSLAQAAAVLSEGRARLESAGIAVAESIAIGDVIPNIVQSQTRMGAELIALGTRRRDPRERGLTGGIATSVARYAACSVLVARDGRPIRSIVLGYDGSPDADAVVALVDRLPLIDRPAVAVCAAYELQADRALRSARILAGVAAAGGDEVGEARNVADALAEDAAARLSRLGLETTIHRLHGRPARALSILAAELGADLIAVGARGVSRGEYGNLVGGTSGEPISFGVASILVARA